MHRNRANHGSRRNTSRNFRGHGQMSRNFSMGPKPKRIVPKINEQLFINKAREAVATTPYIAKNSFADFEISTELKNNILRKGYTTPTPIQDQSIIHILEGRDVIGIANTGTGKTAAFLIPLIDKVFKNRNERVLIVVPTRELAIQIEEELRYLSFGMQIFSTSVMGGSSMKRQISELRRNPGFIIATPGRLKALLKDNFLNAANIANIVLDEVDRMVDIGFIRDIKFIISCLPKQRQSLFFSATVSGEVKDILDSFVTNPVTVSVKQEDTPHTVEQDVVRIGNGQAKIDILHSLLIKDEFKKVMVFGRTKWGIQKLSDKLSERGFKVAAIHGNKSQGQRQKALTSFKNDEIQVLLATDVASRGLDINGVTHVINYDTPESYDDYVHRIGRTGRANARGKALTFID